MDCVRRAWDTRRLSATTLGQQDNGSETRSTLSAAVGSTLSASLTPASLLLVSCLCLPPIRSTTKYNLFTFLPKNLFEQFQKKANFYFLLVAIVSLTPLSPKTPIVSVAPLVLVLTVSAIKEAVEDWQRYKMDRKINSYWVDVWRSDGKQPPIVAQDAASSSAPAPSKGKSPPPKQCGPVALGSGFEPVLWSDLMVGDLVFIREGGAFPADILLLQSSTDQGIAHIETANLDGQCETAQPS